MTNDERREIIRVCGNDFEEQDIPAYIRNRGIETVESLIPICQVRDNYASAAADNAERLAK